MPDRKFINIEKHASPVETLCIRCSVLVNEGMAKRRKRATVTALDITGGGRLPVAYCSDHVPDDMNGPGMGTGAVSCNICGRQLREHTLLETCMAPAIP